MSLFTLFGSEKTELVAASKSAVPEVEPKKVFQYVRSNKIPIVSIYSIIYSLNTLLTTHIFIIITYLLTYIHIHSKVIASYFANKILVFDQLEFPCETSVLVIRGEHLSGKTSELLKYCTIITSNEDGGDVAWKVLVRFLFIFI